MSVETGVLCIIAFILSIILLITTYFLGYWNGRIDELRGKEVR